MNASASGGIALSINYPTLEGPGFPNSKYDDQADSTSQGLDWFKQHSMDWELGVLAFEKSEAQKILAGKPTYLGPAKFNRASALREWDERKFFGSF